MSYPVRRRRKKKQLGSDVQPPAAPVAAPGAADAPIPAESAEDGSSDPEGTMSLREHLTELRTRLLRCVIAVFICFIAIFTVAPFIRGFMEKTLRHALPASGTIAFTDITEPFMVDMHLSFVLGIFAASPYIFYQVWAFIAPGLYDSERKHIVPVALCSALLFISGGLFCYFVVIPFTYKFFIGYGSAVATFFGYESGAATPVITLANMYRYSLRLMFAFGVMFEMPLFSFFLTKLRIITAARLRAWRRYAILANFIIAALITPPDVLSQLLLAGPLILLYELSILVAGYAAPESGSPEAKPAPSSS